jgi:hypothetical protein
MTPQEAGELKTVLQAVESNAFLGSKFWAWLDAYGAKSESLEKGTFFYNAKYGLLAIKQENVNGVARITGLLYAPRSNTDDRKVLISRGRSASGKSLSAADLKTVDAEYSYDAIPKWVIWECAAAVDPLPWDPEQVTATTSIVDDFLEGDDDAVSRQVFLEAVFDELEPRFSIKRPDLFEEWNKFDTVQDVITYVEEHFEKQ